MMRNKDRPRNTRKATAIITSEHRTTAIVASIIMLIVMLGTILVILPSGTLFRQPVQAVATPYFSQNWRVFAPNILKVNRTVDIRAQWRNDNGELVSSGWDNTILLANLACFRSNSPPSEPHRRHSCAMAERQRRTRALRLGLNF